MFFKRKRDNVYLMCVYDDNKDAKTKERFKLIIS